MHFDRRQLARRPAELLAARAADRQRRAAGRLRSAADLKPIKLPPPIGRAERLAAPGQGAGADEAPTASARSSSSPGASLDYFTGVQWWRWNG